MRIDRICRMCWCLFLVLAFSPQLLAAKPAVPDFCFLQVSDLHISPQPEGFRASDENGSADTIAWVCREANSGQKLPASSITTPLPAFVMATGDLTEYGVINTTWANWERYWRPLKLPLFIVAGNHDNTWTSITPIMRRLHGGDNYSFDKFGCHFVVLDSATIQEPLPCLEARVLNFVRQDLQRIPKDMPVFVFQHHPLSTTEFSTPIEQLRFLSALGEHNVVLLAMGHGHAVLAEKWNTLDSVMGGSTFGPNTGYNIISVVDGVLRVVYRHKDPAKPMRMLLEKPITPPNHVAVEISLPGPCTVVNGDSVAVTAHVRGGQAKKMSASIDAQKGNRDELTADSENFTGKLSTHGLLPGMHFVHVKAETDAGSFDQAIEFRYAPLNTKVRATRVELPAGMKAGPVAAEGGCVIATTAGEVVRVNFPVVPDAPQVLSTVLHKTGAEILHSPELVDGTLYFSSAELGVFSLNLDGTLNWKRSVGAAVYGTPAVGSDTVYVGDLEGTVHAIDRKTGELKWSKHHATFSIEMPPTASKDVLYFGAWDGMVYAVNAADGSLKWKAPGPGGQAGQPSRYYAPADSPMVVAGGRLFVTDRAYRFGSYSLDGKYLGQIASGVAAIAPAEDGKAVYARTLGKGVRRYDVEGRQVWSADVPAGHYATGPTELHGKVYACSNHGVLSVLDAGTGSVLWQYQVTAKTPVIGLVTADAAGNAYVAGMDGSVTRVGSD